VVEHLRTSLPELKANLEGKSPIASYLYEIFRDYDREDLTLPAATKTLWDLAPVAWIINDAGFQGRITERPDLTADFTWAFPPGRPLMRVITRLDRDRILQDFFARIG
jgi:hypothetical protein